MKDIVLVMSWQSSHKVVLKSLGTKPQVENNHADKKGNKNKLIKRTTPIISMLFYKISVKTPYDKNNKCQPCQELEPQIWRLKIHKGYEISKIVNTSVFNSVQCGVVLPPTWVRHVLELGTRSENQEHQVEDVENNNDKEEDLHALEKKCICSR